MLVTNSKIRLKHAIPGRRRAERKPRLIVLGVLLFIASGYLCLMCLGLLLFSMDRLVGGGFTPAVLILLLPAAGLAVLGARAVRMGRHPDS